MPPVVAGLFVVRERRRAALDLRVGPKVVCPLCVFLQHPVAQAIRRPFGLLVGFPVAEGVIMEGADLVVGGGGLAAVGVLVVVAGRGGGTVARAKAVGKFGGALVEVGAIEGGGVARTTRDFKSGRKGDCIFLKSGRKKTRTI